MKTSATLAVVVQVFLVYQVTTDVIDITFLQYHFYPVHYNDRCVASHKCTSGTPQQGFHCCPRLEVIHLPGGEGCTKHFCSDSCTQCGRGTLPTKCTSRPQYQTMNIDFTGDPSSRMVFDMNSTVPNIFLVMVCNCYEMSIEKPPMFNKCLRLNASDPFHEIHSVPNKDGYFNISLNISLHTEDLPKRPETELSRVQTTTDVKGLSSTTKVSEFLPVIQPKDNVSDTLVNLMLMAASAGQSRQVSVSIDHVVAYSPCPDGNPDCFPMYYWVCVAFFTDTSSCPVTYHACNDPGHCSSMRMDLATVPQIRLPPQTVTNEKAIRVYITESLTVDDVCRTPSVFDCRTWTTSYQFNNSVFSFQVTLSDVPVTSGSAPVIG